MGCQYRPRKREARPRLAVDGRKSGDNSREAVMWWLRWVWRLRDGRGLPWWWLGHDFELVEEGDGTHGRGEGRPWLAEEVVVHGFCFELGWFMVIETRQRGRAGKGKQSVTGGDDGCEEGERESGKIGLGWATRVAVVGGLKVRPGNLGSLIAGWRRRRRTAWVRRAWAECATSGSPAWILDLSRVGSMAKGLAAAR
ncbi:hypothetical protein M0R45_035533 [Rubus argutus]|uniref:Uncharacterized protein n=1 Tax=Rubus argutus TaxID=59490 RepID=A0AAW1VX94_RUBAR